MPVISKKVKTINNITKIESRSELDGLFSNLEADKLPSLPHVLVVLLDASHTDVIAFDRLSDLIQKDVALSARVVSAASAAYYGGQGKSLSFERTLVMLGLETIKTLAMTASVQQFFSRFDGSSMRRLKHFWGDSLACAIMAKSIAGLVGYRFPDEAYLAGLMHNVGELIFFNSFPMEYDALCDLADEQQDILALETERFGGNRFQAGAWLVDSWDSDTFIADSILYQSEPVDQILDAHPLVKIIYLASKLADSKVEPTATAYTVAERLFDLNQAVTAEILTKARTEVRAAANAMDIDIDDSSAADTRDDAAQADEQKQVELAERVRNIALMKGVTQQLHGASSENDMMRRIQRSLGMLFSVNRSFFFLVDEATKSLVGKPSGEEEAALADFVIPLDSDRSILARAIRDKAPQNSLNVVEHGADAEPASVVDRQIINLTGEQGMICLPLIVDQVELGVLVVGQEPLSDARFTQHMRLLSVFSNEVAAHLLNDRIRSAETTAVEEEEKEFVRARAKEIVHEVNNPLSIVKNYVHILGNKLKEQDGALEELDIIREELDRAGSILLRLPGIVDQETTDSGDDVVNVNSLLSDLLKVFRSSLFATHQIESRLALDENMVAVISNRNKLKQIFTNLVKNAVEALPESGKIKVSTRGLVNLNGKQYIEVLISDDGPGIPADIQAKLFTPVKTTKDKEHAGLGLTIVKSLVDELGGAISCRSGTDSGTSFEILIPRVLKA